jgi:hypothetical protein
VHQGERPVADGLLVVAEGELHPRHRAVRRPTGAEPGGALEVSKGATVVAGGGLQLATEFPEARPLGFQFQPALDVVTGFVEPILVPQDPGPDQVDLRRERGQRNSTVGLGRLGQKRLHLVTRPGYNA